MDPFQNYGSLKDSLELEAILKESSLGEEVAEIIALWTKGCPPRASSISPSLSEVMDIMNSFTAENMIDNIKENDPKNVQSEIEIQKLPTVIITQIFEMLSKDFLEMLSLSVYPGFSEGESGSDAYCQAICLGLTCRHYWAAFSRTWCQAGTNMIIYRPPPSQKKILALLLKTWVGPEY
ncbi:hypothetical protein EAF00_003716 [Botryotinia globosa]|nr:hypothetical protein EAF00_003716 [Botryotinia globosa]